METASDGLRFKTKDKPAGERPDVCPVPLNANAPGVGRAAPTKEAREKAREMLALVARYRNAVDGEIVTENTLTAMVADEREAAERAGWRRAIERVCVWLETKAQILVDGGGDGGEAGTLGVRQYRSDAKFIRSQPYEPPPSEGEKDAVR